LTRGVFLENGSPRQSLAVKRKAANLRRSPYRPPG